MSKKRLILCGIILVCVAMFVYAATCPRAYLQERQSASPDAPSSPSQQEVQGFRMPGVSKTGVLEWLATGKRAILESANSYRVFDLGIDIYAGIDPATGEQQILRITSNTGTIDQTTRHAFLEDEVVMRLDKNTTVHTHAVRYVPADNVMTTDKPMRLVGKDVQIDGLGLTLRLATQKAIVGSDVVVKLHNVQQNFIDIPKPEAKTGPAQPSDGDVTIRCTGKLVLQRESSSAAFHEDVEVVSGDMTLSADEMLVFFDSKTRKPRSLVATGNVVVRDPKAHALGSKLTWDAANQLIALVGEPKVVIVTKQVTLKADRALFYQKENEIETPGHGYLVKRVDPNAPAQGPSAFPAPASTEPAAPPKPIEIVWQGSMVFRRLDHIAVFTKAVKATRGQAQLTSEKLEVFFDDNNEQAQKVQAQGAVKLVEDQRVCTGSRLVFFPDKGTGRLMGDPYAEAKQDDVIVRSKILCFFDKEAKTVADGPGELISAGKPGADPDANPPTHVQWLGRMTMLRKENRAVFEKHVVARRGVNVVCGDTVVANLDSESQVQTLVARGNVDVSQPGRTATSDAFEWKFKDKTLDLVGKPRAHLNQEGCRIACERFLIREADNMLRGIGAGTLTTEPDPDAAKEDAGPVQIEWRDAMLFDGAKHQATFTGKILANKGSAQLNADRLVLLLDEKNQVRDLNAYDNVVLVDGTREGRGDKLNWHWLTDIAELTSKDDSVEVRDSGILGIGERARFFGKTGTFELLRQTQQPTAQAKTDQTPTGDKPKKKPKTIQLLIDR